MVALFGPFPASPKPRRRRDLAETPTRAPLRTGGAPAWGEAAKGHRTAKKDFPRNSKYIKCPKVVLGGSDSINERLPSPFTMASENKNVGSLAGARCSEEFRVHMLGANACLTRPWLVPRIPMPQAQFGAPSHWCSNPWLAPLLTAVFLVRKPVPKYFPCIKCVNHCVKDLKPSLCIRIFGFARL